MKKGILVALAILAAGGGGLAVMAARFEEKIRPNTFIGIVPVGDLSRSRCYEQGVAARVGASMNDRILLIQGPRGSLSGFL